VDLGVDVGDVRVGFARSDLDGLLATPVATRARDTAIQEIVKFSAEIDARVIMVGLPRSLNGGEGPAAAKARAFAADLAQALSAMTSPPGIRFVDERLTTVTAHQALTRSGRKGRKQRSVVDQVAAVMILQQALDQHRATGKEPGEPYRTSGRSDQEETPREG
jgi:putative Holliday junction resolvase